MDFKSRLELQYEVAEQNRLAEEAAKAKIQMETGKNKFDLEAEKVRIKTFSWGRATKSDAAIERLRESQRLQTDLEEQKRVTEIERLRETQRLQIESDREKHQQKLELARITAQLSPTRRSAELTADYYNDDYE